MAKKFVLYSAGAMTWRHEGVFDSREDLNKWIGESYGYSYEDYLSEFPDGNEEDWYEGSELKVEEIDYYPS